jgi:hypothetical protein
MDIHKETTRFPGSMIPWGEALPRHVPIAESARSAPSLVGYNSGPLWQWLPSYFHDGSQETLWDVSDHYNKDDGLQKPYLDEDIQPLALAEGDIDDVLTFLASLTSADYKELGMRELARQRELSRTNRPQRDVASAFGPKPPLPKPRALDSGGN